MLKKADINFTKRTGELTEDEVGRVITIMQIPCQHKIPHWFLNRQKDVKGRIYNQVLANGLQHLGYSCGGPHIKTMGPGLQCVCVQKEINL